MNTYCGVMHMHSTHSYDGKLSLSELKALLLEHGYSFACMSEHTDEMTAKGAEAFVAECRALSDDTFVFVPGFEVPYKDAHILQYGSTDFLGQFADRDRLLAWSAEAPLTILAHPVRNQFVLDSAMEEAIDGVEIWNQQYDGKLVPRTRAANLLRDLRTADQNLIATGGVDFHRREHLGPPQTVMELSELSDSAILEALGSNRFSFGAEALLIDPDAEWQPTVQEHLASVLSVAVITNGKRVNRWLAHLGISLPRRLKERVRKVF